jgi:hypothetical protein
VALPPPGELRIVSSDAQHVVAAYNPLIIACFTRPPRPAELDALERLADDGLAAGVRGGVLYVMARRDMQGGLDPRVRATFEAMTRRNRERSGANAVVVLTAGFGGAMVRGVLAGLTLLAGRSVLQVFGATDDACEWLARMHGLDATAVVQAYRRATIRVDVPL